MTAPDDLPVDVPSDLPSDLRDQLDATRRGEAAGWLAWSQGPAWFPVAMGAWAAVFVLALGYLDQRPRAFAMLALTAASLAYISWQTRRHGVWPTGSAPGFGRSTAFFVAGVVVIVVVGAGVVWTLPAAWLAALVVGVATAGWSWGYGRLYAADAARVRARLEVGR